jgi:hypothetical protein
MTYQIKWSVFLGGSLDYLVGNLEFELTDTLMERVIKMSDKEQVFLLIDDFIAKNKMQAILK